jgi:hypothetical protein
VKSLFALVAWPFVGPVAGALVGFDMGYKNMGVPAAIALGVIGFGLGAVFGLTLGPLIGFFNSGMPN